MFAKRHYEWMVRTLATAEATDWQAAQFVARLAVDNPRFQPDKFRLALDREREKRRITDRAIEAIALQATSSSR